MQYSGLQVYLSSARTPRGISTCTFPAMLFQNPKWEVIKDENRGAGAKKKHPTNFPTIFKGRNYLRIPYPPPSPLFHVGRGVGGGGARRPWNEDWLYLPKEPSHDFKHTQILLPHQRRWNAAKKEETELTAMRDNFYKRVCQATQNKSPAIEWKLSSSC